MTARVLNTDAAACERDLTKSRGAISVQVQIPLIQYTTL